ncbi:uncharacterized protein [Branchiostoma lanceolatum]|uniref:uncharacterized protein n=1 Tax=Branchiostoma lanceolatum TaxID=7740 RepID=UPI003452F4D9
MPKSAQNVTSRMERYQSEITSSGEARKSTSSGDDRKSVATGTLADLRKRWESGERLGYRMTKSKKEKFRRLKMRPSPFERFNAVVDEALGKEIMPKNIVKRIDSRWPKEQR